MRNKTFFIVVLDVLSVARFCGHFISGWRTGELKRKDSDDAAGEEQKGKKILKTENSFLFKFYICLFSHSFTKSIVNRISGYLSGLSIFQTAGNSFGI